jgi:hypothetical protein
MVAMHVAGALVAAAEGAVGSTLAGILLVVVRILFSQRRRNQLRTIRAVTPDATGKFRVILHRMLTEAPEALEENHG